ncbi:hypothetical protein Y1Q_0007339 [Alligator mississippiensis]|uniref:Ig-like domain-containing protein n=1 Tax=Alligator mississippiensis TaxID=8496 RepID=A0A151P7L2_ALLMI|nr:hypothetical protein Y1Q_0007339 [Alligator mississippiensis]
MDTIDWKKDGKPLPEDQDFQLSKNHSILIISEGQKLNCGSYSCNVSNEISWQETTLNWAIAGPSASFIVPEILLTYVIIVTFLVSAAMTIQPAKLNGLKSTTTQHTLDYIVPGGVFLVVLTASLLIKKIQQLHEKACTEFVDITTLTVSTAVVSFLPLLAILVCYHITQRWQKESSSSRRQDLQEIL